MAEVNCFIPFFMTEHRNKTYTVPVNTAHTAEKEVVTPLNKHVRYYDMSAQYAAATDLYMANEIDEVAWVRMVTMKTPLPKYEHLCPHNGR